MEKKFQRLEKRQKTMKSDLTTVGRKVAKFESYKVATRLAKLEQGDRIRQDEMRKLCDKVGLNWSKLYIDAGTIVRESEFLQHKVSEYGAVEGDAEDSPEFAVRASKMEGFLVDILVFLPEAVVLKHKR